MAYEVFLKLKDEDLSFKAFQELFSGRKNCRIEGGFAVYENPNTGAGFYFEYMDEESEDALNVRSDGVYRVAVCVEYCQPAFFFVEALYEMHDLVENDGFVAYDPQIGGRPGGGVFDDKEIFESWTVCNTEVVREYMISLGEDMRSIPVMAYDTLREMWEWNYQLDRLREILDKNMQIPTIQTIEFGEEDLTAVVWKDGGPIALPYVDVILFARSKGNGGVEQEYDFCAVDYEEVKPLIEKYSGESFENAFLLDYDAVPKEIKGFIALLDPAVEFAFTDMCDVFEYEIVREAMLPEIEAFEDVD